MGKQFVGKKACTANIYDIHYGLMQTEQQIINRDDIPAALEKQNVLRQVRTLQISTNIKFGSIEFDTPTTIETFCLEPLEIQDDFCLLYSRLQNISQKIYTKKVHLYKLFKCSIQDRRTITNRLCRPSCRRRGISKIPKKDTQRNWIQHWDKDLQSDKLFRRTVKCIYTRQPEEDETSIASDDNKETNLQPDIQNNNENNTTEQSTTKNDIEPQTNQSNKKDQSKFTIQQTRALHKKQ